MAGNIDVSSKDLDMNNHKTFWETMLGALKSIARATLPDSVLGPEDSAPKRHLGNMPKEYSKGK